MSTRSVFLRSATAGGPLMVIDRQGSTAPTHVEISEVPTETSTDQVILVVSYLVFFPWPKKSISWSTIKNLQQGAIVRT